jgi:hypothetical protein
METRVDMEAYGQHEFPVMRSIYILQAQKKSINVIIISYSLIEDRGYDCKVREV